MERSPRTDAIRVAALAAPRLAVASCAVGVVAGGRRRQVGDAVKSRVQECGGRRVQCGSEFARQGVLSLSLLSTHTS